MSLAKWNGFLRHLLPAFAAVFLLGITVCAQIPVAGPLTFDVASVKPMAPNPRGMRWGLAPAPGDVPGTRVHLYANLLNIIETAYNLQPNQVGGEPAWVDSQAGNFAIDAVPAQPSTDDQLRSMLQNLLAERFKLQVKIEARTVPGYAIRIAKGGLKDLPPVAPTLDARGNPVMNGRAMTVAEFAAFALKPGADGYNTVRSRQYLPVEDQTGLTARYNFFAALGRAFLSPANPPGKYHPAGVAPETISELLSGSIGLELVKTKVTRPFLTIVRIDKPTPN